LILSKDNERLKLVRKLHEKSWRDKLGLFFVEGEDAIEAATATPVDLLRAGEDVEPKLLAEVASAAPIRPRPRHCARARARSGACRSASGMQVTDCYKVRRA